MIWMIQINRHFTILTQESSIHLHGAETHRQRSCAQMSVVLACTTDISKEPCLVHTHTHTLSTLSRCSESEPEFTLMLSGVQAEDAGDYTVWVCICWPAHTNIESYKTSLKVDCVQTAVLQLWPVAGAFAMHRCLQRLLEVHPQPKGKWNSDFHVPDLQVLFPFWKHLIMHPVFLFKKKVAQMRNQCRSSLFLY